MHFFTELKVSIYRASGAILREIAPVTAIIWILTAIMCCLLIAAAFGDWRI